MKGRLPSSISPLFPVCLSLPPSHLSSGTVLQQQPAMLCWFLAGRWGSPGKLGLTAGGRDTADTCANRDKPLVNMSRVVISTLEKYNIYMQTMLSALMENVLCSSLFYNSFDAFFPRNHTKSVNASPWVERVACFSHLCILLFSSAYYLFHWKKLVINISNRPELSAKRNSTSIYLKSIIMEHFF